MADTLVCKPSLDVVFKTLFTENPDLLRDFLTLVLETEIDSMDIINPDLIPEQFNEKFARLDLVIKTKNNDKINVELQNRDEGNYKERSVYNCSKLFTTELIKGTDYSEIRNTICINIMQFPLFESENYRSTVYPIIQEPFQACRAVRLLAMLSQAQTALFLRHPPSSERFRAYGRRRSSCEQHQQPS
jgi:predicted transposase/invertase (TIGR01784 family)